MPYTASIKDRVETTIVSLLLEDSTLAILVPREQNVTNKPKKPFIAVVATPNGTIPGSNIFRTGVSIALNFGAKELNQDPVALDECADLVYTKLKEARDAGAYGLILDGETQTFPDENSRTRTINCTVIAAAI